MQKESLLTPYRAKVSALLCKRLKALDLRFFAFIRGFSGQRKRGFRNPSVGLQTLMQGSLIMGQINKGEYNKPKEHLNWTHPEYFIRAIISLSSMMTF